MWNYFLEFLRSNPVGLLFAVLGLGYLVGKTKIRGFEIGSITGVLFVGLVFGHFGFDFNPTVQSIGFVLFIFSVGLQAGPSFFSVLRQDGAKYFALAVVIALTGFSLALSLSKLLGFAPGAAAGLLSGGLTSSPTLAAAQEAIRAGDVPEAHERAGIARSAATARPDLDDLFRVRVSETKPREPGIAVEYRDHWFFIPDSDHASKRTFGLLQALFLSQMTKDAAQGAPVLTLPLN